MLTKKELKQIKGGQIEIPQVFSDERNVNKTSTCSCTFNNANPESTNINRKEGCVCICG